MSDEQLMDSCTPSHSKLEEDMKVYCVVEDVGGYPVGFLLSKIYSSRKDAEAHISESSKAMIAEGHNPLNLVIWEEEVVASDK